MPSGYTADLPKDTLIDVAVLSREVSGAQVPLGVSRGGLTFTPRKEFRNVEFDGKRTEVAGLDRITSHGATIAGTFIQFGAKQIAELEPASTATTAGGVTTIQPPAASVLIPQGELVPNLTLTYQRLGGGTVKVVFPYALCTEYSVGSQDNSEAEVQCSFAARLSAADAAISTDKAPYRIIVTDP